MQVSVIQYGMGHMGQRLIQLMLRKGFNIVAAIDSKTDYLGKDIGEIAGLDQKVGVKVTNDIADVLKNVKADIVSHATVSYLAPLYDQIKPFIEAGLNVVSLAEEMSYPWHTHPELAKQIDKDAKAHNVSVIGTGVNPGFIMDLVPLIYVSACWSIDKIRIQRVVDFSVYNPERNRRRYGVRADEFRKSVLEGTMPMHIGLYEDMTMIADAVGWKLEEISESWEVMTSRSIREVPYGIIEPGTTCGWRHSAIGTIKGEAKIIMDMYSMGSRPILEEDGVELGDIILIDGEPSITIQTGGVSERGELCTAARQVNILAAVIEAKPGLISVKDLPATPSLPDK